MLQHYYFSISTLMNFIVTVIMASTAAALMCIKYRLRDRFFADLLTFYSLLLTFCSKHLSTIPQIVALVHKTSRTCFAFRATLINIPHID